MKRILNLFIFLILAILTVSCEQMNGNNNEGVDYNKQLGVTDLQDVVNKIDSVLSAHKAKYEGKDVLVINATDMNVFTETQVIAVIDVSDGKVLNAIVRGNPGITTHMSSDADFTLEKLGVIGMTDADELKKISGATISSNSIRKCFEKIFDQARVLGVKPWVPTTAKFISCEQNLDAVISGNYDLFDVKVNLISSNFETGIDVNLTVSFAGGKQILTCDQTLNEEEAASVLRAVKQPSTYVESCDVFDRVFVVSVNNSFGGTFTLNVVLNEDNTIASFTATSTNSHPSFTSHFDDYDLEINASIAGAVGQVIGGDAFESVSGVTVSTNTFKAGLDLIARIIYR